MNDISNIGLATTPLKFGYMARVKQQEQLTWEELRDKTEKITEDYSIGLPVHLGPRLNGDVGLAQDLVIGHNESDKTKTFVEALDAIVQKNIVSEQEKRNLLIQARLLGVQSLEPKVDLIVRKTQEAGRFELAQPFRQAYSELVNAEYPVVLEGSENAGIESNPFGVLMDLKPMQRSSFDFGISTGTKARGFLSSKDELWVISGQSDVDFVKAQNTNGKPYENIIAELKAKQLERLA